MKQETPFGNEILVEGLMAVFKALASLILGHPFVIQPLRCCARLYVCHHYMSQKLSTYLPVERKLLPWGWPQQKHPELSLFRHCLLAYSILCQSTLSLQYSVIVLMSCTGDLPLTPPSLNSALIHTLDKVILICFQHMF